MESKVKVIATSKVNDLETEGDAIIAIVRDGDEQEFFIHGSMGYGDLLGAVMYFQEEVVDCLIDTTKNSGKLSSEGKDAIVNGLEEYKKVNESLCVETMQFIKDIIDKDSILETINKAIAEMLK